MVAIAIPLIVFTLACTRVRQPLFDSAFWTATPRSGLLWVSCGLWFLFGTYVFMRIPNWGCRGDTDVAYFFGMMRALRTATPAHNPELAGAFLTHSSGYWFWYACLERITGLDTQQTLFLLGALLAVVILVLVHRLSHLLWQDDIAAIATVLLLWIPSESAWPWIVSRRALESPRPIKTFGDSLLIAWYNGPALILMLLTVGTFVWLVRTPESTKPFVVLLLLLVLFPFHHAMYYGITLCGLAPYFAWAVATRRLPKRAMLCFLTWLPWKALAWAWPQVMLAGDPRFTVGLEDLPRDLFKTLTRHGLLLPLALFGIRRKGAGGTGALLSMVGVLVLPGPWAGPWNRHWQWDPMALSLALFAGAGVGRLVRCRSGLAAVLAALWVAPNVAFFGKQSYGRIGRRLAVGISRCAGPPGLREAAVWLRDHSPRSTRIATLPASIEGQYVEVYGERPLVFGDALHLDMVDPAVQWRSIEADMARLYQPEVQNELRSILDRHGVGYVLLTCAVDADCPPKSSAIGSMLPVVFKSGRVIVLRVLPKS